MMPYLRNWRGSVLGLLAMLAAPPALPQDGVKLNPVQGSTPYRPMDYRINPYGLKSAHQTIDKDQIKTYFRDVLGLGEGKVEESELNRLLPMFEKKFNVYLADRDVLETSGLDRQGLINAISKSLLANPTQLQENQPSYRNSNGDWVSWRDLSNNERLAIRVQIENGTFGIYNRDVRLPGLSPSDPRFGAFANEQFYYPNGSQKTSAVPRAYDNSQSFTVNTKPKITITDLKYFYEHGVDVHQLEDRFKAYYSNGRSRYDRDGNEVYPNGRRKYSDDGTPLYSNGRPKFDRMGNALHSNGRLMANSAGIPLYADGRPMLSDSGASLFRSGRKRFTGDGQRPEGEAAEMSDNRQLYAGGTASETSEGVRLHANGRKMFNDDGLGKNPYAKYRAGAIIDPALPQDGDSRPTRSSFVTELYSNSRPAASEDGNRLYSNSRPRSADDGSYLYPDQQTFANGDNRALTPDGAMVASTSGYRGRPQGGPFPLYEIVDASIVSLSGDEVTLRAKNRKELIKAKRSGSVVSRELDGGAALGDPQRLSAKLVGRAILLRNERFLNGMNIDDEDSGPILAGFVTTDSSVEIRRPTNGAYKIWRIVEGNALRFDRDVLVVQNDVDRKELRLGLSGASFQRTLGKRVTPAPLRSITLSSPVVAVVEQDQTFVDGSLSSTSPPKAIAIIER